MARRYKANPDAPIGRPTKGTPELKDKVLSMYFRGDTLRAIGQSVGIRPQTIWSWRNMDDEFRERMEIASTLRAFQAQEQRNRRLMDRLRTVYPMVAFDDTVGDDAD